MDCGLYDALIDWRWGWGWKDTEQKVGDQIAIQKVGDQIAIDRQLLRC